MGYKIRNTKSLRRKLFPFHDEYQCICDEFHEKRAVIEGKMEKATRIEGVEFFYGDGDYIGIGNMDRTMPLIFFEDIEKVRK